MNAWWGSFDLAVNLFSGQPAEPPSKDFLMRNAMDSQEIAVGWWAGNADYPRAAFYAYAHPAPDGFAHADLSPGRWDANLGEFVLDWDVVLATPRPARHRTDLRPLGRTPCLRNLRLGSGAGEQPRGTASARQLTAIGRGHRTEGLCFVAVSTTKPSHRRSQ